jgi:pyruvate dehydrogenase E1 component
MLQAAMIPNCHAYDPTFAYEMAVIIHHGMKRMYVEQDNVFYYITAMNENYSHPDMPDGVEEGIIKGLYLFRKGNHKKKLRVNLMGSGTIFREVITAAELLENDFNVSADIWGVPSFIELRRDALDCERWNMLHPEAETKVPFISKVFENKHEPYIAATDYIRSYPDQVRQWIPDSYTVLGTDGYGRSDTRAALRRHFEVDRYYIVVAALKSLADQEKIPADTVTQAISKYEINAERNNPIDL